MKSTARYMTGFPLGIFSAIIVTASLFMVMPMLTQINLAPPAETKPEAFLIEKWKPSPPPSETRDDQKTQTPLETKIIDKKVRPRREQPKIDIPRGNSLIGINNGIEIDISSTFREIVSIPDQIYNQTEVDQSPRVLRSFPPQYPYLAKRDNIEGWVVLRFVVDTEGMAEKVEVVAADPVGIFEEAALKAVTRYRFKAAIKNGEAVNCIIKQRIRFTLD